MANAEPIIGPMPGTDEWYAKRLWVDGEGVFGASDAAALCGLSPYAQPLNIYRRCLGMETVKETERMRMGKRLEPVIRDIYSERAASDMEAPIPMLISRERPFVAATPDAKRISDGRLVELKSTTWRRAAELGEHGTDWVPDDWYLQVQQQMYVTGEEVADIAVLVDRDTFLVYEIRRSDEVIEHILDAAEDMRRRLLERDPPPPDWEHPATPALVKKLYGVTEQTVTLDAEVLSWWERSEELKRQIAELQKEREQLRAKVRAAMGHAAVGRLPGASIELVRREVHVKEAVRKAYSFVSLRARKVR